MKLQNTPQKFGAVAIALHWVIAILIVSQIILASNAEAAPMGFTKFVLLSKHKTWGMLVLFMALFRLGWKLFNPTPAYPHTMSAFEKMAAKASHFLFYTLIIAIPLAGWSIAGAADISINFFDLFVVPNFIAPNKGLVDPLKLAHKFLVMSLMALIVVHVAAALWHHFKLKDNVLSRMLPLIKSRS